MVFVEIATEIKQSFERMHSKESIRLIEPLEPIDFRQMSSEILCVLTQFVVIRHCDLSMCAFEVNEPKNENCSSAFYAHAHMHHNFFVSHAQSAQNLDYCRMFSSLKYTDDDDPWKIVKTITS